MRRLLLLLSVLGLLAGGMIPAIRPVAAAPPKAPEFIPGQYIVLLKGPAPATGATATRLARGHGLRVRFTYRKALRGFACQATEAAAQALARQPEVAAVIPDLRVRASVQTLPTGVNRIDADSQDGIMPVRIDGVPDSPNVDVAVVDTGVTPHPDLNVFRWVDFTGFGDHDDGSLHGTHVAGIVGAQDNDLGVVGACPGARIWSLRVLGPDGSGALSTVAMAFDYVAAQNQDPAGEKIEVVNASLGAYYPPIYAALFGDPLETAVQNAVASGAVVTVAAGNDSANASNYIPARYAGAVCVSAMDDQDGQAGGDSLAYFSNFGSVVDAIAPGVAILSTTPGDGYESFSGTSIASPHAAGAAAAYLLAHSGATPAQVLNVFRSNAEAAPAGGWPGDPDGIAERAVNVPLLLGAAPGGGGGGGGGGTPADFTVTVQVNPSSVRRGGSTLITVRATQTNGSPVAGAPTTLTVTDSRGRSSSGSGITGADGSIAWVLGTNRRDPVGTWRAHGSVTWSGQTRTGETTFQVR